MRPMAGGARGDPGHGAIVVTGAELNRELSTAFDLSRTPEGKFRAPYFTDQRGVVFGGQLIGQAVVAATRCVADKRVRTVQTIFAKGASLADPVDIDVQVMQDGRSVASAMVTFSQSGRLCARSLVLLDTAEPDLVFHQIPMPAVPPPDPGHARPHWMAAPETIIVGGVDIDDPAATGPAELQMWVRFADFDRTDFTMARALVAHATDGWLIGTAMRPHPGLGQSMAHRQVSTGVLAHDITFHGDFSAADWLLMDLAAQATGGGRTYGRGHVFTEQGVLVASFVQQALLRRFPADHRAGAQSSTVF